MTVETYFAAEGCFITELSNSEHDPELSIARARVEPGKTTAWHRLRDTTERYLIVSGTGKVELGNEEPRVVTSGDVVVILPMQRQRIENLGDEDLVFLALCTPRFIPENYLSADDQ